MWIQEQDCSFEAQGQCFYRFAATDTAELTEKVLEGGLGIASTGFVDVFLLANLGFGHLGQVGAIEDGERQEGESDQCVGGDDADSTTPTARMGTAGDGELDAMVSKDDRNHQHEEDRERDCEGFACIEMRHEHSWAATIGRKAETRWIGPDENRPGSGGVLCEEGRRTLE